MGHCLGGLGVELNVEDVVDGERRVEAEVDLAGGEVRGEVEGEAPARLHVESELGLEPLDQPVGAHGEQKQEGRASIGLGAARARLAWVNGKVLPIDVARLWRCAQLDVAVVEGGERELGPLLAPAAPLVREPLPQRTAELADQSIALRLQLEDDEGMPGAEAATDAAQLITQRLLLVTRLGQLLANLDATAVCDPRRLGAELLHLHLLGVDPLCELDLLLALAGHLDVVNALARKAEPLQVLVQLLLELVAVLACVDTLYHHRVVCRRPQCAVGILDHRALHPPHSDHEEDEEEDVGDLAVRRRVRLALAELGVGRVHKRVGRRHRQHDRADVRVLLARAQPEEAERLHIEE
mmetsp:Transcript_18358/g.37406  ORF Transcript_18358/g.37406 Transcript_18358/m.37406 type:complete len:353 (+) Transcript_18358:284-1342(+)